MDRVKISRNLFSASLMALAAVTFLSLCRADAPNTQPGVRSPAVHKVVKGQSIQQALGVSNSQHGVIQQVAGKQPKPRTTRPGLLEVLTGSKPKGDANHQHKNMPNGDSKGLLGVLFSADSKSAAEKDRSNPDSKTAGQSKGRSSLGSGTGSARPLFSLGISTKKSSSKSTASSKATNSSKVKSNKTTSTKTASSSRPKSKSEPVNWDGIPYHSASVVRRDAEPRPIRDPDAGSQERGMRVIQGGSRTNAAKTVSKRQLSSVDSAESVTNLAVPQPPRDVEPIPVPRKFSSTVSSRRSNRRTLQPLKQQSTALSPIKTLAVPKEEKQLVEADELVPRVARKKVQKNVAESEKSVKAAPAKSTNEIASKEVVKDAASIKPVPQTSVPQASDVVDTKSVTVPGMPRIVLGRRASVTKVPSHDVAIREPAPTPAPALAPIQASESQTAVAAIGVPLESPSAIASTSDVRESVEPSVLSVPRPVSSSALQPPQSVAIVPALPDDSPVADALNTGPSNVPKTVASDGPTIATFPEITLNTGAASGTRFPQPVLAPQPTLSPQPAYTIPVSPTAPGIPYAASAPILGPPAATASHRAGPPSSAFGSAGVGSQATSEVSSDSSVARSMPIGSGIAIGSSTPLHTNGVDSSYSSDPVAIRNDTNRRIKQPMTPSVGLQTSQTQQLGSGAAIANSFSGNPNRIATNFNRSADAGNRMRSPGQITGLTNSTSELPGIRVATFGPSEVTIRQVNEYEIRVENRGTIDARGVIVRASIPDWAEMKGQNVSVGNVNADSKANLEHLVWTIDRLPAGTSGKMVIRLIAARSGSYGLDVDWTMQPQKSVAKVRVHEPRLDLTIEGPDQVIYGMSQTYKVRVLNPGDGTAPNVVFTLSPNSASPQTQRIGDIPAGKEAQFDVELTAQDLGDLKIHGLAFGDLELKSEASKTIRVAAAKLEAVLSGPQLKYQHAEAMYGLQLQNNGAAASDNIIATLRLPTGVKYLGGMEGVIVEGNVLKWRLSSLKPGTMQNYQFRCQMDTTGEHVFAFDCAGTAAGATDVSIATRVESIADLVLTVADPAAPAPIGSDVTYEILIKNRGSKEAINVRAVAQFGHGIEPLRIEGHTGEVVPGQVMFNPIPQIGPGAEVRLRVIARAEKAGHHRFRAEVHSGDTMLVAEEATHYMNSQSDRVSRRSSAAGSR